MESQDTPIQTNVILEAIAGLRQDVNNQIADLRQDVSNQIADLRQEMNERFNNIEARLRFAEDEIGKIKDEIGKIKDEIVEIKMRVVNIEERITGVEKRMTGIEERMTNIETEMAGLKNEFFSFDVRLMRVEAGMHEALSIGKTLQADMAIVKAEVQAWSSDVMDLRQKVA